WFEGSSTDSFGPLTPLADGLGFVGASACLHYLGELGRREKYLGWVADGSLGNGYGIDEFAAVLFRDGELVEAVAERCDHPARRVVRDASSGRAVEIDLPVRRLA
ncbi:MAG: peptidase E, partial [Micrococcales bacterium]|nr:peptidase E [Micrococcales bacterium]